ncbi:SIR2 family protein [Aquihabitans sp. G128]|uniref:SIR2 family NAD-dependent protein deacylase n=1 Tax=Aquihabitans sp. G128 TaxID=2849779 RepID=UPI001C246854|nr:SIR2 family protein [Aquihabitans sp. G128]QXC62348.1 SIR2 family protein [Aquihabitans sp. G128]
MNDSRDDEFDESLRLEGPLVVADVELDPADALWSLDEESYKAKALDWQDERRAAHEQRLAEILQFKANGERYSALMKAIEESQVVPFVGAGLSAPCGAATWGELMQQLIDHLNTPLESASALLSEGRFEEAAEAIATALGEPLFLERVQANIGLARHLRGAVRHLPTIFDGLTITTNLDRILEKSDTAFGSPYADIFYQAIPDAFQDLVSQNHHMLLKLHGDELIAETWVLRSSQYDERYGPMEAPDLERPWPSALAWVYRVKSVLFIGCSLSVDRTVRVFEAVIAKHGAVTVPSHYAFLPRPLDDVTWDERELLLAEHRIYPIWYPHGDHECVESLIFGLMERD